MLKKREAPGCPSVECGTAEAVVAVAEAALEAGGELHRVVLLCDDVHAEFLGTDEVARGTGHPVRSAGLAQEARLEGRRGPAPALVGVRGLAGLVPPGHAAAPLENLSGQMSPLARLHARLVLVHARTRRAVRLLESKLLILQLRPEGGRRKSAPCSLFKGWCIFARNNARLGALPSSRNFFIRCRRCTLQKPFTAPTKVDVCVSQHPTTLHAGRPCGMGSSIISAEVLCLYSN